MTDFFISYTHQDRDWAEWIGYVLEEEGYTVVIQAWDFRPGSNFVLEMQNAATESARTILVLSPDYLKSQFASPEWATAFAQDPQGLNNRLVPVLVRPCEPKGLLTTVVQIRIVGTDEVTARTHLIAGVRNKRAKPSERPFFPGGIVAPRPKTFPGSNEADIDTVRPSKLIPPISLKPSDLDKRRFVKHGFELIQAVFEKNLGAVEEQEERIQTDFQLRSNTDFRAEIFLDGNSAGLCRIWQGCMHSDNNICFSEGSVPSDNSCNEIIMLGEDTDLFFSATMAMGIYGYEKNRNTKRMTADEVAQYLWDRFVSKLNGR